MKEIYDSEIAGFLMFHIENPCGVEVDGKRVNIRNFYLERAREILPNLTNPFAKRALELKIGEYCR